MITLEAVRAHAATLEGSAKVAYESLIANESETTQKSIAEGFRGATPTYLKAAGFPVELGWEDRVLNEMTLAQLLNIVEVGDSRIKSSLKNKILTALFGDLLTGLLGMVTDLPLGSLSKEEREKAGDGIYLAGLYRVLLDRAYPQG